MLKSILRWGTTLAALFAIGPAAALLLRGLESPNGDPRTTPMLSDNPGLAMTAVLALYLIVAATSVIGARLTDLRLGMTAGGLVLAWAAWRTGTAEAVLRGSGGGTLSRLAVEGAINGLLVVVIAVLIARFGTHSRRAHPLSKLASLPVLAALLAACVAGGLGVWFIAVSALKGQAVMACVLGGVAASVATQLTLSSFEPEGVNPLHALIVPVVAIALLATLGPIAASMVHGSGLGDAVLRGDLFELARPMPLDWAAGALLGAPAGASWAGSMIEKRLGAQAQA